MRTPVVGRICGSELLCGVTTYAPANDIHCEEAISSTASLYPKKRGTPLGLVAAAAADEAGGDSDAAAARLDEASELQWRYPTYYGSAWVALGRIMLASSLLGECPSGSGRFVDRGI